MLKLFQSNFKRRWQLCIVILSWEMSFDVFDFLTFISSNCLLVSFQNLVDKNSEWKALSETHVFVRSSFHKSRLRNGLDSWRFAATSVDNACQHNTITSRRSLLSRKRCFGTILPSSLPVSIGYELSRLPHFREVGVTYGGEIVILTRRRSSPPPPPRMIPNTHFC
jgi:hypothetical protein